jgi:[acyl-carrier-protein] S-malonyltransferase
MKAAFVFPGQGSQYVGMGKDIYDRYEKAKDLYQVASEICHRDVPNLSFFGPERVLRDSRNAQISIMTLSLAILEILKDHNIIPDIIAGHSVGQYAAIVASEALDLNEGLRLVARRGEIMSNVGNKPPGTMAAINGLTFEEVERLRRAAEEVGPVCVANHNTKTQHVVSGAVEAVGRVVDLATKHGGKAVHLPVSGAFHSPLMQDAAIQFEKVIEELSVKTPKYMLIGNSGADLLQSSTEVRYEMMRHMMSPVRWCETIERMLEQGFHTFVEVGPGRVLKGLILRIWRHARVYTTGTANELSMAIAALSPGREN